MTRSFILVCIAGHCVTAKFRIMFTSLGRITAVLLKFPIGLNLEFYCHRVYWVQFIFIFSWESVTVQKGVGRWFSNVWRLIQIFPRFHTGGATKGGVGVENGSDVIYGHSLIEFLSEFFVSCGKTSYRKWFIQNFPLEILSRLFSI